MNTYEITKLVDYSEYNTRVRECYLLSNRQIKLLAQYIMETRKQKGLIVRENYKSYMYEIKAHKRLYKLGIARSHTIHADLEEYLDKWKELLWRIIGV